jgi:hypothetical protein
MAKYNLQITADDGARIKSTVGSCLDSTAFALYMVHCFAEDPEPEAPEGQHVRTFRQKVREFIQASDEYSQAIGAQRGARP